MPHIKKEGENVIIVLMDMRWVKECHEQDEPNVQTRLL